MAPRTLCIQERLGYTGGKWTITSPWSCQFFTDLLLLHPRSIKTVPALGVPSDLHFLVKAPMYMYQFNKICMLFSSNLSSVQFSHSVVSNILRPHESQHTRPPCPSPSPGVHSDSGPLSQWCHPAISSSVVPFSSCPQSLPASESFQWVNSSREVAKLLKLQL